VILGKFFTDEDFQPTVFMRREIKNRCLACCWGRISCSTESFDPELERESAVKKKDPHI